jgi:hypothetical protein
MTIDQERRSPVNERSALRVRAERVKNEEMREHRLRALPALPTRPPEHDAEKQPPHPDQARVQALREDNMLDFLESTTFMRLINSIKTHRSKLRQAP